MTLLFILLAAGAATAVAAAPAAAQTPYYPQQYPALPNPPAYPQQSYPGYGYQQPGYGQNPIQQVIDQLLGNRYNVNDRTAVQHCATAAVNQATAQYRPRGYGVYGQQGYAYGQQGYGQSYNPAMMMRVASVTEVRRIRNGVRVSGQIDSRGGYAQPPYGQAYGYQNQRYAAQGDLTFRCNVDYRGSVSNVRIGRNTAAYRRR